MRNSTTNNEARPCVIDTPSSPPLDANMSASSFEVMPRPPQQTPIANTKSTVNATPSPMTRTLASTTYSTSNKTTSLTRDRSTPQGGIFSNSSSHARMSVSCMNGRTSMNGMGAFITSCEYD
uniref:Uncharacterized protein n=1 Tax=Lygus hesperus TaxID=30085 RepID=A0A0A9WL20_LYGHE